MIELFQRFAIDSATASELDQAIERLLDSKGKGPWRLVDSAEKYVRSLLPGEAFDFDAEEFATLHFEEHSWKAGRFSTPSIGELKQRATANLNGNHRTRLWVFTGAHPATDIGGLQATATPGSLFQAASQFNCLESPTSTITDVVDYFLDYTQGPRASISAFPGTLLRHYAATKNKGKRFAQSDHRQINLLEDVFSTDIATVRSGYLTASSIIDPAKLIESLTLNFDKIRIGMHEDVQVVLGQDFRGSVDNSPERLISQVFTSTLAGGMYGGKSMDPTQIIHLCTLLLRGAYLGTLLAGAVLKQKRVVLTLIGGGVFANPVPLIWNSILWAMQRVEPYLAEDLDVIVNGRNLGDDVPKDRLSQVAREWNGRLLVFPNDGLPTVWP